MPIIAHFSAFDLSVRFFSLGRPLDPSDPRQRFSDPATGRPLEFLPPRRPGQLWPPPPVSLTTDDQCLGAR